jgi:hypothetical protein
MFRWFTYTHNVDDRLGLCHHCQSCWVHAGARELVETGYVHNYGRSGIPRRFHHQLDPVEVDRAGQMMGGTCKYQAI